MWQGMLSTLAPIASGALALYLHHGRQTDRSDAQHWTHAVGRNGIVVVGVFAVMMWLVPAGALLALPLMLALSVLSPAAREEWMEHRTPRLLALGVAVVCLGATGLLPVAQPPAPEEWGQPLFTENPHAPLYPASQQYTWVTNDIVVLQSITMRLPHQPGAIGAEGVALMLASVLGMETARMHQAIELIDAEVAFVRLNPDEIVLAPVASPTSMDVRLDSEQVESVALRKYDIKTTAFGTDAGGAKVGEVVAVAKASWGGQLDVLVIVRPLAHPTLTTDDLGETWTQAWLSAR